MCNYKFSINLSQADLAAFGNALLVVSVKEWWKISDTGIHSVNGLLFISLSGSVFGRQTVLLVPSNHCTSTLSCFTSITFPSCGNFSQYLSRKVRTYCPTAGDDSFLFLGLALMITCNEISKND